MIRTFVLAALLVGAGFTSAADITPLAGKPIKGTLVALDATTLTVKDADGTERKIPVKEMASVDLGGKALNLADKTFDEIELIDGSLVRATSNSFKLKADKGECLPLGGTGEGPNVALPLRSLFYVMRDAHKGSNKDDWKKLLASRGKRDMLVIREKFENGDRLSPIEGTVLDGFMDGTTPRINFEQVSGEKARFPINRFSGGIVFNQPPRAEIPPMLCRVIDAHGNALLATAVKLEGTGLIVTTVGGATVQYPALAGVVSLDFRQGNVKYLGEFEPLVQSPKAIEGEPNFTFMRDKTAAGTPLRLDGKIFAKGLWIFPDTTLTIPLNGEYKTFKVVVGVDDTVQIASSSVRVIIEADGRKLFNQVVSRKDKPRDLTLDVKDAKELKITVDREALYAGNQVNLCEARVQK